MHAHSQGSTEALAGLAQVHAVAGDMRDMKRIVPDLIELTREPYFAGLHADAKFRELVSRIGWRRVVAD